MLTRRWTPSDRPTVTLKAEADSQAIARHRSIAITYDRYGHQMPGSEAEAAGLLDAYLREQTG
jgi:hypothetical protein